MRSSGSGIADEKGGVGGGGGGSSSKYTHPPPEMRCLSVCLSLFVRPSVCLSLSLSVCLSVNVCNVPRLERGA